VTRARWSMTRGGECSWNARSGDGQGQRQVLVARGIEREDVERRRVLAKPGSINLRTKFEATVLRVIKEKGRHTPFFNRYRPQFYFRTTDVTGSVELAEGTEW